VVAKFIAEPHEAFLSVDGEILPLHAGELHTGVVVIVIFVPFSGLMRPLVGGRQGGTEERSKRTKGIRKKGVPIRVSTAWIIVSYHFHSWNRVNRFDVYNSFPSMQSLCQPAQQLLLPSDLQCVIIKLIEIRFRQNVPL
jgi:hypothetical protein